MNRTVVVFSSFWFLAIVAVSGAFLVSGVPRSVLIMIGSLAFVISGVVSLHSDSASKNERKSGGDVAAALLIAVVGGALVIWGRPFEYAAVRYASAAVVLLLGAVSWRKEVSRWKQA